MLKKVYRHFPLDLSEIYQHNKVSQYRTFSMTIDFNPVYTISLSIAKDLMRIEAAKQKVSLLPVNPKILATLRETAKLYTTHYSTMIEGNRLTLPQIKEVYSE